MTDQKQPKDCWMKDNALFICDGWKYGTAKDGQTVCVGSVAVATQTTPVAKEGVTTPEPEGLHTPQVVTPQTVSPLSDKIMAIKDWEKLGSRTIAKQLRKEGVEVSHMTINRMQRKLRQGSLF